MSKESKERLGIQIDLVEQQWLEVAREYGEIMATLEKLRDKRRQLKKQIDNLTEAVDQYDSKT